MKKFVAIFSLLQHRMGWGLLNLLFEFSLQFFLDYLLLLGSYRFHLTQNSCFLEVQFFDHPHTLYL